ncbi:MAG: CHAD domain-containing protein, partial [Rhizobiaceae bacterium]|nr:CHAD domain-containing protein [Rhizobiaceae bacterium]
MSEIELKLLLDPATAKGIWPQARSLGLAEKVPAARLLRTVYWDTPARALRRAGIVLRMRRDGRRWLQTVKCDGSLSGGLSVTQECEVAARAGRLDIQAIPDEQVRDRVAALVLGAVLEPVCETAIRRASGLVRLADGTAAELAVDIGRIIAGERSAELQEAEIELVEGNAARLFEIARMLLPVGALRFSRLAKSARCFLLAEEGFVEPPVAPRNAVAPAIEAGQTVERAACSVLRECLEQVAANVLAARDLDDPEAVHQLRVGLRRLRSALRVFAGPVGGSAADALGAEARWLAAEAGQVRDLDVAAAELLRPEADAHPELPALGDLADRVTAEAAAARARLRELLAQARVQDFLLDLACFTG